MKNIFFIICCFSLIACKQNPKNTEIKNPVTKTSEISRSSEKLCFLSLVGNTEIQGKKVQDSLVLQLEIRGKDVTGIYNWIPAEKDSRRGKISAEKEGNSIQGSYVFAQEGTQQSQPIHIELQENGVKVATNSGQPDEMKVKIEKVDCW
ncbi:MAG TPA: hypothetical protein VFM82_04930 [Flavobacteriaceae bacterium]|nr:hypothetical protein [Flavobacteriaceae bacterium]